MDGLLKLYGLLKPTFDKIYSIHLCSIDELEKLLSFIDEYWQKGHILTKSKELLNWQHFDRNNQCYNFVIATNNTGEIHGILGFILSSIYDNDIVTPIRWGAIWKIREDVAIKGLGVMLKGFLEQRVPVDYIGGVGLSKYSKTIDEKLGEKMGRLSQYYIANPNIKEYNLISAPLFQANIQNKNNKQMEYILEKDFFEYATKLEDKIMPYKSIKYYINRYYRHPIYKYEGIGIFENDEVIAILIIRKASYKENSCIFVVDYIGDGSELSGCYGLFLDLLQTYSAEYICFPCYGIRDSYMREAGFSLREDSLMILPIYYEPFERKNVELDFHFWTNSDFSGEIIVKGDSDQDRPNRV